MPFTVERCVALTEITLLQFFKSLPKYLLIKDAQTIHISNLLAKQNMECRTKIDQLNNLLLDFYESVIDLINVSLDIKLKFSLTNKHIENANQLIVKEFNKVIQIYKSLPKELLEYLYDEQKTYAPGRQTLYFLILSIIIHRDKWNFSAIAREWIQGLSIISKNDNEKNLLEFCGFILEQSNDLSVCAQGNPFIDYFITVTHSLSIFQSYIRARQQRSSAAIINQLSELKDEIPDVVKELFSNPIMGYMFQDANSKIKAPTLEEHPSLKIISQFPVFLKNVPDFMQSFVKIHMSLHILTSVIFEEHCKGFYFEIIELLAKYNYLLTSQEKIEELILLSKVTIFVEQINLLSFKFQLIPDDNHLFNHSKYILIHRLVGLFEWQCKEKISPELLQLIFQSIDSLLSNPDKLQHYQFLAHKFWFTVVKVFMTEYTPGSNLEVIIGKHFYLIVDNLYQHQLESVAIQFIEKFTRLQSVKELSEAVSIRKRERLAINLLSKQYSVYQVKQIQELLYYCEFLNLVMYELSPNNDNPKQFLTFLDKPQPHLSLMNSQFLKEKFTVLPRAFSSTLIYRTPQLIEFISTHADSTTKHKLEKLIFKLIFILSIKSEEKQQLEQAFQVMNDAELRKLEMEIGYDRNEPESFEANVDIENDDCITLVAETCVEDDSDEKSQASTSVCHSFAKSQAHNLIEKFAIPLQVLKLTSIVNQVFKKPLILRGGAVMDLLFKKAISEINDYDPIVFNQDLTQLQSALTAHCFPLIHLDDTEFSQLQTRINIYKLLKNAHKSDYKLKVFTLHEALEIQKACHRLPDIAKKIVCKAELEGLIVGKNSREVLIIENQGVHIDVVNFSTSSKTLSEQLKTYRQSADFETSALYMELNLAKDYFVIDGDPQAFLAIHQQCISVVKNKPDVFEEDPIRLFRLIKEILKNPNFKPDLHLKKILEKTDFRQLFSKFFEQDMSLYRGRISIAISKLLEHHSVINVLRTINELKLFENLFGLEYSILQSQFDVFENLEHMSAYQKKLVLFQLIYANLCYHYPVDAERMALPMSIVVKQVSPVDLLFRSKFSN
jgi:hypothetical protein